MGLVAADTGSNRQPAPIGTHLAFCFGLVDVGTQTSTFDGEMKAAHKVWIWFELTEEKQPDGKPLTVGTFASVSLHEKATLRKWLEAWRGKAFTPDELKGFKLTNIVGVPCMVTIAHKPKKSGGISDIVQSVTAPPKGVKPSAPMQNPRTILDLDTFDKPTYDALPNFLKDMIHKSPEGLKAVPHPSAATGGSTNGSGPYDPEADASSIPF